MTKRHGLSHVRTGLWLLDVAPHARALAEEDRLPQGRTDIELDVIERLAMARCDGLAVTDPAVAQWCHASDWRL